MTPHWKIENSKIYWILINPKRYFMRKQVSLFFLVDKIMAKTKEFGVKKGSRGQKSISAMEKCCVSIVQIHLRNFCVCLGWENKQERMSTCSLFRHAFLEKQPCSKEISSILDPTCNICVWSERKRTTWSSNHQKTYVFISCIIKTWSENTDLRCELYSVLLWYFGKSGKCCKQLRCTSLISTI